MFEKEIKFIIDFTLNRINKLGAFFTFERLASAEIHPAMILYISNKLDFLIYEDRKKLLQNSSFDYSGSEIAKYFKLIAEEIKKNKRLALEDVRTLVTQAVTFNINYLVSPNNTLLNLIFTENKSRNVNEIKMMLNYLYYYDYVRNVFLGYFSRRKLLSLSETEFSLILNKIDKQMFSSRTNDLIDNALTSIADFFNEGGVNKTRIPAQTIELFLKEKNLMEGLFKLRRSIPAEDKSKYDIEEIRKILYSREQLKVQPKTEKEEVSEEIVQETGESKDVENLTEDNAEPSATEDIEEVKSKGSEDIQETNSVAEEHPEIEKIIEENSKEQSHDDFLTRYESELKSLEELEARLNELNEEMLSSETEEVEDEKEIISEPQVEETTDIEEIKSKPVESDSMTFEEIMMEPSESEGDNPNKEQSDELIIEEEEISLSTGVYTESSGDRKRRGKENDLMKFLSEKEIDRIVTNVFNEDGEDFVNTMERISESASYDEATEILKAVFSSYKVSPYSKDAVALTNAVSNFFNKD